MWSWQFQQKPLAPADTHGIQPRLSMGNPMFPSPRMSSNLSSFCSWRKLSFVAWCDETCDETPSHQTIKPIKSSVLSMKSGYWCSGACNIYIYMIIAYTYNIYIYTHTCLSYGVLSTKTVCRIAELLRPPSLVPEKPGPAVTDIQGTCWTKWDKVEESGSKSHLEMRENEKQMKEK